MSVAAATSTESKTQSSPVSLRVAGFFGAVFILAALAVVFFGVPELWRMGVSGWLAPVLGTTFDNALRWFAQFAAAIGLAIFGIALAGPNPPHGVRGAIFLGISSIIAAFFLGRAAIMISERVAAGKLDAPNIISFLFVGTCLFFFYKFLFSDRFPRWAVVLDSSGWFDTHSYKKQQGARVRRLTIFGLILLFGSGIYTMVHNSIVPYGDWTISLPMSGGHLLLLPNAHFTVPLILAVLTLWFSWRVVNFPTFADFLIATEAEINKVSWTPRARLIQDTIVVLITVFIITLFLFLVDIFWGWILSREVVGILPSQEATKRTDTKQVNKSDY